MRILGVDPGSSATGYGLVEFSGGKLSHVAHGVLRMRRGDALASRLAQIHEGLTAVAAEYRPQLVVVERHPV